MKVGPPTSYLLVVEHEGMVEILPESYATVSKAKRAQALLDENDPADIFALCPMEEG